MTYYDIKARLASAGIDHPDVESALLLSRFCDVGSAELLFSKQRDFDSPALEAALARRERHEPLQYILGEWEFFGLPFEVGPDCLIPRPDTELLCEMAISLVPKNARIADFCTGSGCIAVAVLHHRPDLAAVLVDAFEGTLSLAGRNCQRNGVQARADLVLQDLLQPLDGVFAEKFDCILSNPPYIPTEVVKGLAPELAFEPQVALDGGQDGMLFYRHFLKQSRHLLKDGGFWLFEIGYDQEQAITAQAAACGFACRVYRDLGGNPRVAHVYKEN